MAIASLLCDNPHLFQPTLAYLRPMLLGAPAYMIMWTVSIMISTDGGQVENPHWELAYEQYMQYMADHGVSEDELHYMTHTIQAGLLNLED